jgi:hypothetical protein
MIRCSWETLKTFAQNDPQLQGKAGAISVLHTHSRRLDYHDRHGRRECMREAGAGVVPHVHVVMPATAIDADERLWRTKTGKANKSYLFSHKALAKVFRAKLLSAIREEGLELPACYPKTWVVDVKSVGSGDKALVYLGRYLYKGVIQEKDIIACRDGWVTFRYQDSKTKRMQTRTLPGPQFLWLILQHVLPKGFRRARNFGFLHPNSKRLLELLRQLLKLNPVKILTGLAKRPQIKCPCCGGAMRIVQTRIPSPLAFGRLAPSG